MTLAERLPAGSVVEILRPEGLTGAAQFTFQHVFVVAAASEDVRRILEDAGALEKCLPGVDTVKAIGDGEHTAWVLADIGPVRMQFVVKASCVRQGGNRWTLVAGGASRRAESGCEIVLDLELIACGERSSKLRLFSEISAAGRLSSVPAPLFQLAADRTVGWFAANLRNAVETRRRSAIKRPQARARRRKARRA